MPLSYPRMQAISRQMGQSRVVVVGDVMLDEYLLGSVDRISPEAPVPVVEISSTRTLLGGAANVAANIRALGDEPILVGTCGIDDAADKLRRLLSEKDISSRYLMRDESRRTTIKTRIIAHSQQVVRADREDRHALSAALESQILEIISSLAESIAAVIISDYGKGVVSRDLLSQLVPLCYDKGIFVAVDPKDANFFNYQKASLITPNHHEAGFAYGRKIRTEEDLIEVGNGLLSRLDARSILITRGPQGMSLFQADRSPTHIPTFARKVYDVTGAGDTVVASFVSAVAAGAELVEAAIIANAAAGFTVGEIGTATISVEQLTHELERHIQDGNLNAVMTA